MDDTDMMDGLLQSFTEGKFVPGQQHTIERKKGARKNLELNIFVIHARAARSIERFKAMALVAKKVGGILKSKSFKLAINNVTYGHGAKVFNQWLQDSVRGSSTYDSSAVSRGLRWLRMAGINFVLGYKLLTAAKQGISLFPAIGVDPGMAPLLMKNLMLGATPGKFAAIEKFASSDLSDSVSVLTISDKKPHIPGVVSLS